MPSTIEEAVEEIRHGRMVIIVDNEDRENEGDFVMAAEKATAEAVNFMITHGKGLVCCTISKERAEALGLAQMTLENTDPNATQFTTSVDSNTATTGISPYERAFTINQLANPKASNKDFRKPGHVFPLVANKGGVLKRQGHTEASVELATLADLTPAGVVCEIIKPDGTMARRPYLEEFAQEHNLKIISISDLVKFISKTRKIIEKTSESTLPTEYGFFKVKCFKELSEDRQHLALISGEINPETQILVRIHSECLTGDVFSSKKCDCGFQLKSSMEKISREGGILIYLRQEGRGIGLANKIKAYALQENGLDTVEANHALGFPSDMRDYTAAAEILKALGIKKMRLLTNNPAKTTAMKANDLEVTEVIPLEVKANYFNASYLNTKKEKLGHTLTLTGEVK